MEKVMVIINPAAGKGGGLNFRETLKYLRARILRETSKALEIVESSESGEYSIFNLASFAKEQGYKDVFVVGGDGSVSLAAKALIDSQTVLSVIPMGSGNDFSAALLIPKNPIEALRTALFGKVVELDVGLIDKKDIFVNVVSFGFDGKIAQLVPQIKERCQFLPQDCLYLASLFCGFFSPIDYPDLTVFCKDENPYLMEGPRETLLLAVSNGPRYGRIFNIWPGASFVDGLLNICWISKMSKLKIMKNLPKIIKGTHGNLPEVDMFVSPSILISSSKRLDCQLDGEIFFSKKEYQISVLRKMLKVRTPYLLVDSPYKERKNKKIEGLEPLAVSSGC